MTVDYGIDLGTTNSSIAVLNGTETEVFENNEGQKYTPSVVSIDKRGRLYVGRRAKNQLESDPDNAHSEFKLQMGTSHTYRFHGNGRVMKPEELSAEVLKSLLGDVQQRTQEEVHASVITVPAAFELPQCEATQKAARSAGLTLSPLLQEPIAAALAYGFQRESGRTFWLVYDMGGGTFDAAIIHVRDGIIQVVNHGGDNHLGGKLVDWEIVDQLLVPALKKEYALSDFMRGNPKWRPALAKLKLHAEEAKIQLSREKVTQIYVDPLCRDDRGDWVQFEYEMRRADLETLIEPGIERSVNICRAVLAEEKLGPNDIAKVLLVGGPTLAPLLREILSDRLRIELELSVDPLTVVCRGAAVFAGTQRLPDVSPRPVQAGQYSIELEYKPIDNDPEPLVAGKICAAEGTTISNLTIEFVESKTQWRSGKVAVSSDGAFMTSLRAEKGRPNEFLIELRNGSGKQLHLAPDQLTYTMGTTITSQPLIHSIGVALANNHVQIFMEKGSELPSRRREVFRTTAEVKKGLSGTLLRIPVVEGEHKTRADRNRLIGNLIITGDKINRDVPVGSEVEVTIVIDDSRQVHTLAYIPILDEEYEEVLRFEKPSIDPDELAEDVEKEEARLDDLRSKVQQTPHPRTEPILRRIDKERMIHDIEASLAAARNDRDAADKCQNRLIDLKAALDEIESSMKWPSLVAEAQKLLAETQDFADMDADEATRTLFKVIEMETRNTIEALDPESLSRQISKLQDLSTEILMQQPSFWVEYLHYLSERKSHMNDPALANRLFEQSQRAVKNQDFQSLESSVRRLVSLLPVSEQEEIRDLRSTIMPVAK
jgi:molecular chaperone DnaK